MIDASDPVPRPPQRKVPALMNIHRATAAAHNGPVPASEEYVYTRWDPNADTPKVASADVDTIVINGDDDGYDGGHDGHSETIEDEIARHEAEAEAARHKTRLADIRQRLENAVLAPVRFNCVERADPLAGDYVPLKHEATHRVLGDARTGDVAFTSNAATSLLLSRQFEAVARKDVVIQETEERMHIMDCVFATLRLQMQRDHGMSMRAARAMVEESRSREVEAQATVVDKIVELEAASRKRLEQISEECVSMLDREITRAFHVMSLGEAAAERNWAEQQEERSRQYIVLEADRGLSRVFAQEVSEAQAMKVREMLQQRVPVGAGPRATVPGEDSHRHIAPNAPTGRGASSEAVAGASEVPAHRVHDPAFDDDPTFVDNAAAFPAATAAAGRFDGHADPATATSDHYGSTAAETDVTPPPNVADAFADDVFNMAGSQPRNDDRSASGTLYGEKAIVPPLPLGLVSKSQFYGTVASSAAHGDFGGAQAFADHEAVPRELRPTQPAPAGMASEIQGARLLDTATASRSESRGGSVAAVSDAWGFEGPEDFTPYWGNMFKSDGILMSWQRRFFVVTSTGKVKCAITDKGPWQVLFRAENILRVELDSYQDSNTGGGTAPPTSQYAQHGFYVEVADPKRPAGKPKKIRFCAPTRKDLTAWITVLRRATDVVFTRARRAEIAAETPDLVADGKSPSVSANKAVGSAEPQRPACVPVLEIAAAVKSYAANTGHYPSYRQRAAMEDDAKARALMKKRAAAGKVDGEVKEARLDPNPPQPLNARSDVFGTPPDVSYSQARSSVSPARH